MLLLITHFYSSLCNYTFAFPETMSATFVNILLQKAKSLAINLMKFQNEEEETRRIKRNKKKKRKEEEAYQSSFGHLGRTADWYGCPTTIKYGNKA